MVQTLIHGKLYSDKDKAAILAAYVRESLLRDIDFAYDDPHGISNDRAEVKDYIVNLKVVAGMAGLDWDELVRTYGPSQFELARVEEILA